MWDLFEINNHGDRKFPKDRAVSLPNALFMAYNWGLILSTYDKWEDPASRDLGYYGAQSLFTGEKGFRGIFSLVCSKDLSK